MVVVLLVFVVVVDVVVVVVVVVVVKFSMETPAVLPGRAKGCVRLMWG